MRSGLLFRQQLRRDHEARQAALATVARRADGWYAGRVGGAVRGHEVCGPTRRDVEAQVHRHYGRAMTRYVLALAARAKKERVCG